MCTGNLHSLVVVRALEDIWIAPPLNKGLKLIKRSNEMLNATAVSLKCQGKENIQYKPAKLSTHFEQPTLTSPYHPLLLYQRFFCRSGREGQRTVKTTSFKFDVDLIACNYETMVHDEASKNHPCRITDIFRPKSWPECTEQTTWTTARTPRNCTCPN